MLGFAPLLLAWSVAVVTPGPDFLAVLRTAASRGRSAGLRVGFGVVCGIACWAGLALAGFSALMARYEHLYLVVRTAGAVLLVAYGVHILWATRRPEPSAAAGPGEAPVSPEDAARSGSHWKLGMFTNLANPKALVFFGALFATLMPHDQGAVARVVLLVIMLAMALVWFAAVSWCAGAAPVVAIYQRVQRGIDRVAGGLFTVIGATLLPR